MSACNTLSDLPTGPMAGVRVLDLSSVLLGPMAAQMLGDLGADVIKIEAPQGDLSRSIGPARNPGMGSMFLGCNRNKRSLVLDLKQPEAQRVLSRLVAASDVVLHSVRTEAAERIGLGYEAVRAANPKAIYCHVGGFSDDGPYGGLPAFDDIIQAASGLAQLQRVHCDSPRYLPTLTADKTTGLYTAYAIAAALFGRERTGQGQAVHVPMFETMAAFNLTEHLWGHTFEPPIDKMVYGSIRTGLRRPYPTQDGYISVVPYTDAHWKTFFCTIGKPAMVEDPRFATLAARTANFEVVLGELSEALRRKTTAQWIAEFRALDIPAMAIQSLEDLPDDPHLTARGFWQTASHPSEGEIRMPGIPYRFSMTPGEIRRLPPGLGSHSREVLREFGFEDAQVAALIATGAVVQGT